MSGGDTSRGHFLDGRGDAVHVVKRVGKPSPLLIAEKCRSRSSYYPGHLPQPLTARLTKGVNIRTEHCGNQNQRTYHLNAFDKTGTRQLCDKLSDKTVTELPGDEIRHEERTTLRLRHAGGLASQRSFHFGLREIGGEFFPKRGVSGHGDLKDLSRGNPLREKTQLFRQAELRWIAALHES